MATENDDLGITGIGSDEAKELIAELNKQQPTAGTSAPRSSQTSSQGEELGALEAELNAELASASEAGESTLNVGSGLSQADKEAALTFSIGETIKTGESPETDESGSALGNLGTGTTLADLAGGTTQAPPTPAAPATGAGELPKFTGMPKAAQVEAQKMQVSEESVETTTAQTMQTGGELPKVSVMPGLEGAAPSAPAAAITPEPEIALEPENLDGQASIEQPVQASLGNQPVAPISGNIAKPEFSKTEDLRPLRTLEGDMVHAIQSQRASLASIALRSIDKRRSGNEAPADLGVKSKRSNILIGGTLLFLILAIGIGGYFMFLYQKPVDTSDLPVASFTPNQLVFSEETVTLELVGPSSSENYQQIVGHLLTTAGRRAGTIEHVIFGAKDPTTGLDFDLNSAQFISAINLSIDDQFVRNLEADYTYGIYSRAGKTDAFILFSPTSFQNAFAELLSWEPRIAPELYRLLAGVAPGDELLNDPDRPARERAWQDTIIRNIDARVLKDDSGKIRMIYSFLPTRDLLIMAVSEETFIEVVTRLQTPSNVIR